MGNPKSYYCSLCVRKVITRKQIHNCPNCGSRVRKLSLSDKRMDKAKKEFVELLDTLDSNDIGQ